MEKATFFTVFGRVQKKMDTLRSRRGAVASRARKFGDESVEGECCVSSAVCLSGGLAAAE